MKYCKNCGGQIADDAKFCTKCGNAIAEESQTDAVVPVAEASVDATNTPAPAAQSQAAPKKPVDLSFFDKHFWMLYILTGVCSYLLIELGGIFSNVSTGFSIFLGIIAIIASLLFLAMGILRKIMSLRVEKEERKKTKLRDNLCLAISIVGFVYVLIAAIGIFISANVMNNIFDALFGAIK